MQAELVKEQRGELGAFDKWEQRAFHVTNSEHSGRASESQTKDANVYTVNGYDMDITAIDTPGLADTMGMSQDEQHLMKMQAAVLRERHINCVVLVINGRVPRATAQISYVLSRLTSVLPSAIADKIVVVYTRVDIKEMLEFDPATIAQAINRPIPQEHEFVFDNPFACVELLQRSGKRTGQPPSAKALRKLKQGFVDSGSEFQTLLKHMTTFPPVDVKVFKELFDAKEAIEQEVVILDNLLKENATKQAKINHAVQDIESAKEWKQKYQSYQEEEVIQSWVEVPNASGTHDMVCNGCKRSCHVNCFIEQSDDPQRFKACECFSAKTSKTLKIRDADDLAAVKAKVSVVKGNVVSIEKQDVLTEGAEWLEIAENCQLCGVQVMGNPQADDYGHYEVWVKDVPFTHKADTPGGYNMDSLKIGAKIPMRDWSNLMKGPKASCGTCGCRMGIHGHQKFKWQKTFEKKSIINAEMKAKYDKYQSEEQQKEGVLSGLRSELRRLEAEADTCKAKLQQAVSTFKEKSTQTSYVRVLRAQIEYLDFQKEVTNGDANIRSDVRDARLKAIADQQHMIQANLSVLDNVEKSSSAYDRKPRVKTRQCDVCHGKGSYFQYMGWRTVQCNACNGTGQVAKV